MNPRAIICDVYNTLIRVGPPPPDAAQRWDLLWHGYFNHPPPLTLLQISVEANDRIATAHRQARDHGIHCPEIWWPDILRSVLPELDHLTAKQLEHFVLAHMQLGRSLQRMPSAAETLLAAHRRGVLLGIASNAQAYTRSEIAEWLGPAGLTLDHFHPQLRAWSFELGFSKPNPHFLRTLAARLRGLGIRSRETLMVGDRFENDIAPAQAQGWLTWQLAPAQLPTGPASGPWLDLQRALEHPPCPA